MDIQPGFILPEWPLDIRHQIAAPVLLQYKIAPPQNGEEHIFAALLN